MKVRVFHDSHEMLPQDRMPEEFPKIHWARPKKLSWEEALAQFEKPEPPKPTSSEETPQ
jgi:hypothetical protein